MTAAHWSILGLLVICLFLKVVKTENVFYMLTGKRLNATTIKIYEGISREHCIGMCFLDNNYRSLNVFQHNGVHVCELFNIDQCELNMELIDDPWSSYMDTVPEGECPTSKCITFYPKSKPPNTNFDIVYLNIFPSVTPSKRSPELI